MAQIMTWSNLLIFNLTIYYSNHVYTLKKANYTWYRPRHYCAGLWHY